MSKPISFHVLSELTPDQRAALLRRTESDLQPFLDKVGPIIEAVRVEGDEALGRFARDFDGSPVQANAIAASPQDFEDAFKAVDEEM
ncbi:MAG: histidinol dehydrogenase, partial [Pseudomonadota bacterium]